MASGLALPLPSSRRLEWAGWWGAEPDEWAMLSPKDTDQVEETEEAPGWQMDQFREWRQGEDEPTYFYFDFWCDGDGEPDVAAYTGEIFIPGMGDCGTGGCYVREVPGPLVFKCVLSVGHALQLFGAAFTTVAGREIFRVAQKRLPSWLTMRDLIAMATDAAKADGLLRSQNQELCVLLAGYAGATPLCPQTVLWSKQLPRAGLMQCG